MCSICLRCPYYTQNLTLPCLYSTDILTRITVDYRHSDMWTPSTLRSVFQTTLLLRFKTLVFSSCLFAGPDLFDFQLSCERKQPCSMTPTLSQNQCVFRRKGPWAGLTCWWWRLEDARCVRQTGFVGKRENGNIGQWTRIDLEESKVVYKKGVYHCHLQWPRIETSLGAHETIGS